MGRPLGVENKGPRHIWSDEEKQYLAEITPGRGYKEIQSMMSCKFGFDYTHHQIKGAITRNKLNTGRTGRFEKGHATWNKGTKATYNNIKSMLSSKNTIGEASGLHVKFNNWKDRWMSGSQDYVRSARSSSEDADSDTMISFKSALRGVELEREVSGFDESLTKMAYMESSTP